MKKLKIAFWVLLIGFFGLLIYQNQDLFLGKKGLSINLYFTAYRIPEIPNAVYYLAFFLVGMLVSYFATLAQRFKANKTIKELNATADANLQKVVRLETELNALKKPEAASDDVPPVDAAS